MAAPWLKVQGTLSRDPKVIRAGIWGGIVWRVLLEMTKAQGWEGAFRRDEVDAEILLVHLNARDADLDGIPRDRLAKCLMAGLDRCVEVGLLRDDKGLLVITSWAKHQPPSSTPRVQAFRARVKELSEGMDPRHPRRR